MHDEAHDDANELQNGDKEGTERGGTAVEVGHLLRRGDQREVLERVVVTALEIVLDKDAGDDEVAHGDDPLRAPQETKEVIREDTLQVAVPRRLVTAVAAGRVGRGDAVHHRRHSTVHGTVLHFDFTRRVQEDEGEEPVHEEENHHDSRDDGEQGDRRHLTDSTRRHLDDADGHLDTAKHHHGEEEEDDGESQDNVGDDLERVLTFFSGIGVVGDRVGGTGGRLAHVRGDFIGADDTRLQKQVNSERDGERVDAEEHRVCEETREISKKEEEEDAQDDRTNATGDEDNLPTGGKVINVAFNRRERTREHLFDLVADALGERTQRGVAERIRVATGGHKRVLRVLVTIAIVLARVERVRGLEENRVTRSLHRARVALLRRGQLAVVVVAVRFPISLGVRRARRRADRIIAHPVHGVRDGSNRRGVLGLRTVLQANALGVSQIVLGADASRIRRVNPRREHNLPGIDEITRLVVFVIAVPAHLPAVIRAEEQNLRITRADAVKAEHEHRDPKHDEEE